MIDYQTFHQIRQLCDQEHLSAAQIAAALQLDERTVGKWIDCETYQPRAQAKRPSKLDPHKGTIVRLLAIILSPPSNCSSDCGRVVTPAATASLRSMCSTVRPPHQPGLSQAPLCSGPDGPSGLGFAPAFLPVGNTRRRLSFFVMVLCYSRRLYVEFTLAQTQEHFLACHQHAFEYFNRVDGRSDGRQLQDGRAVPSPMEHPPCCIRVTWILPATMASRSRLVAHRSRMKRGGWKTGWITSSRTSWPACSSPAWRPSMPRAAAGWTKWPTCGCMGRRTKSPRNSFTGKAHTATVDRDAL